MGGGGGRGWGSGRAGFWGGLRFGPSPRSAACAGPAPEPVLSFPPQQQSVPRHAVRGGEGGAAGQQDQEAQVRTLPCARLRPRAPLRALTWSSSLRFVETVELQISLKNYDPQKDKRFSGTVRFGILLLTPSLQPAALSRGRRPCCRPCC